MRIMVAVAVVLFVGTACADTTLTLDLQRRDSKTDAVSITHEKVPAARVAVIVVDMWDYHWCATWCGRAGAMIPRMNHALAAARKLGMTVIFAPTDCVAGHAGTPARERMTAVTKHALPKPIAFDPPAPWSFGLGSGCMCGGPFPCEVNYDNSAQDKRLIVAEGDYISAGLEEVHNLCKEKGISHLLYMGGATNMCLCQKPEGMIGMTRYGYSCALCRDCTEAHGPNTGSEHADRNTAFSVACIEKHIGPSIDFAAELRKLGKWEDVPIDPVLIAPWGFKNRPKLFEDSLAVSLSMPHIAGTTIRFTLDGTEPSATSTAYEKPISLTSTTTLRAKAFKSGKRVGIESEGYFSKLGPVPPIPDVFASDLRPTKMSLAGWTDLYEQGPAVPGPQMDKSYLKGDLRLRERIYRKGIGVKAPANLVYEVNAEYEAFVAQAGVDESCLRIDLGRGRAMFPSVVFAVFVDGRQAATSPVMRISQEPWRFHVPLPKGAKTISLAVTDAGDGGREDFCHWVNAGFVLRPENRPPPMHAAVGKPVTLAIPPAPVYSQGGPAILTDGQAPAIHQRRGCLGFEGTDLDATIDLGAPTAIHSLGASFLQDTAGGIYLPTKVEFSVSDDGKTFRAVGTATHTVAASEAGPLARTLRLDITEAKARYVRAVARSIGKIPVGQPAAGAKAWMFADEVLVNLKESKR
jgi:nicotinamidase-related amidase